MILVSVGVDLQGLAPAAGGAAVEGQDFGVSGDDGAPVGALGTGGGGGAVGQDNHLGQRRAAGLVADDKQGKDH